MKLNFLLGVWLGLAILADAGTDSVDDTCSLLQTSVLSRSRAQQDLVFVHIPMNFGNSVALTAAVGSGSTLAYEEVSGAAQEGWTRVNEMVQPGAPVWGPMNPDLQAQSELGYPMFYTPSKYWPKELADQYFGNKTVFGILRDPYERMVALFRASGGVARGWEFTSDNKSCATQLNSVVKMMLRPLLDDPSSVPNPNLAIQADYFEGPHAVTLPIDLDEFPQSANTVLQEHGYHINIREADMLHVVGCDDTWSGDLDDEARDMIKTYYARDFELRCLHFGYCDTTANHCCYHVPGMCPGNLFAWDSGSAMYKKMHHL